ncbi:iron-containing redox enzyme family protein [Lysobacter sp. S4-A87]|uniref:iron-containing redox enzyme family protein n=1 Tax=Lysobacter sp. S4-A87 TaxID=2925843 RepID=UPI001F534D0E|nr:iron-containing redox enzyme family protein [Lysobacter sp. S4-A87]UNK48719.1 iron-containing redox enzyme family protein [Lysobacter sp. S4-A87]
MGDEQSRETATRWSTQSEMQPCCEKYARVELSRVGRMTLLKSLGAQATPSFESGVMHSGALDRQSFWQFADAAKEATEALAAQKMAVLPQLSIEDLRQVCTQYRFFTIDYISDLALLVAKLPFGGLRSLLSEILAEELGEGDPDKAHPAIYDRFLATIGVEPAQLHRSLPANRANLDSLTRQLSARSSAFGVGLRGMGGECLCQTYLSVMFEHLQTHPYMREHADRIDWEFWTIHTGEQDIIHGELTRQAIDDYIRHEPGALSELAQGYECSITAWNQFWQNIFDACRTRPGSVS